MRRNEGAFINICMCCLILLVRVHYVRSFNNYESRAMSDCWNYGIRCSNHSGCKFDSTKNKLTCLCTPGFKGELCDEDKNECSMGSPPCRKHGICHNSIGSFRCDCFPGWSGSHCHISDGSVQKACKIGYTGANCVDDFDECNEWQDNPCEHGSTCANVPGNFSCSCAFGWTGRICNEDMDECNITSGLCHNGGNCTNIPGTYRCDCPYPYTGPSCDDVISGFTTLMHSVDVNSGFTMLTHSITSEGKLDTKGQTSSVAEWRGWIWTIVGVSVGSICGALLLCAIIIALCMYHKNYRIQRQLGTIDDSKQDTVDW